MLSCIIAQSYKRAKQDRGLQLLASVQMTAFIPGQGLHEGTGNRQVRPIDFVDSTRKTNMCTLVAHSRIAWMMEDFLAKI